MDNTVHRTVTSRDGAAIAFDQSGDGPVIVLVSAALSDRADTAKLGLHLASAFTVINYDRRGRGRSTNGLPYAIEREVEDIEALIDDAGGQAYLFGSSSGGVLALEAASRLGVKVRGVVMYEPPFIVDESRPPMPDDFAGQINQLLLAGRNNQAVKLFFNKGMGIPGVFVTLMRWLMPGWSKMAAMAHTLSYDLAVLEGTQTGKPLPPRRWAEAHAPTLVMVGGKSEPFFHVGANALVSILPRAQYRVLEGRDHSAVMIAPEAVADVVSGFLLTELQ